jgi:hypothetical protein
MTKAILIPTDDRPKVVDIPEQDSLRFLQESVGGYIDCVRADDFVGYVNDEGLIYGLEMNLTASILFQRHLVGNVVVVGAFSSEGVYDGDNHDAPDYLMALFAI